MQLFFSKVLSFFWPIVIKKYHSNFSGTIEITYSYGKKIVDTKNANYSYGSLQKILKIGLQNIHLPTVENVLILGLGGGSVVETLRKHYNYNKTITAIEIDPVMIEICKKEFGLYSGDNLQIIEEDAFNYTKTNTKKFDLIIVDLFIDTKVPEEFYSKTFFKSLQQNSAKDGQIIINLSLENQEDKISKNTIKQVFTNRKITFLEKVNGTNTLVLIKP